MDTPQRRVAVVSSSYQRFRAWCAENGMNPRDPSLCLVQRIDHVRGRWFDDVVYLGENQLHLLDAARSRLRSRTSA